MDLREVVKQKAKERGITLRAVADKSDLSPQGLNQILSGKAPGWRYRKKIARALKVPLRSLFPDGAY